MLRPLGWPENSSPRLVDSNQWFTNPLKCWRLWRVKANPNGRWWSTFSSRLSRLSFPPSVSPLVSAEPSWPIHDLLQNHSARMPTVSSPGGLLLFHSFDSYISDTAKRFVSDKAIIYCNIVKSTRLCWNRLSYKINVKTSKFSVKKFLWMET